MIEVLDEKIPSTSGPNPDCTDFFDQIGMRRKMQYHAIGRRVGSTREQRSQVSKSMAFRGPAARPDPENPGHGF
jgi:hypothetical protein